MQPKTDFDLGESLVNLAPEEWEEPIPLEQCSSLPDFPVDALPEPGREMVERTAEVTQVDPSLVGPIYLACIAAAVAKAAHVDLGTHIEPLNLFAMSILESGNRKSSTSSILTGPLFEWQHMREAEVKVDIRDAKNSQKILEQRLAKLQKDAANLKDRDERMIAEEEASKVLREMEENPIPNLPMFIVDDITPEKLADAMADNGERMAIISAEGGIFAIMAGRYNEKGGGNIDIFLKGHSGDPCSIHRIGREPKTMESPALTMCLSVQPDVITEIGANRQFRGRGLTARFLYALCRSYVGNRPRQTSSISDELRKTYRDHIFGLMNIPRTGVRIRLSPEGQRLWDEFYWDIETDMRAGGSLEYLPDWGSKLPGAVARIAGLLHFAQNGMKALETPISVTSVGAACVLGVYFKEHALAVYGVMNTDPAMEAAKKILNAITRLNLSAFKGRDIIHHTNLKKMAEVEPGLKILIERGYIRELQRGQSHGGRPESQSYAANPRLFRSKTSNESNKRGAE